MLVAAEHIVCFAMVVIWSWWRGVDVVYLGLL